MITNDGVNYTKFDSIIKRGEIPIRKNFLFCIASIIPGAYEFSKNERDSGFAFRPGKVR